MQLKKCDRCAKVLEFYHLGKFYLKKRDEKYYLAKNKASNYYL